MRRLVLAAAAAATAGLVFVVACSSPDTGGTTPDGGTGAGPDAAAQAGADVDTSSVPPDASSADAGSGDTGSAPDTGSAGGSDASSGSDAGSCPIAATDPCLVALKADLDTAAQCFPHRNNCSATPADPSGCGSYTDTAHTQCAWTDGATAVLNDTQFTWDETTKSPTGTQCYRLQLSLFNQSGSLELSSRTWDFTLNINTFEVTFTCPAGGTLTLSPDNFEACTGQPRPDQVCCSAATPPACQ